MHYVESLMKVAHVYAKAMGSPLRNSSQDKLNLNSISMSQVKLPKLHNRSVIQSSDLTNEVNEILNNNNPYENRFHPSSLRRRPMQQHSHNSSISKDPYLYNEYKA